MPRVGGMWMSFLTVTLAYSVVTSLNTTTARLSQILTTPSLVFVNLYQSMCEMTIFAFFHTRTGKHVWKTSCCWKEPRLPPISCLAAQPPNHPPALNHPATHAGRAETPGWGLTTGMQKESIRHHWLQSAVVLHWKLGAGIVDWEPNASLRGVLEPTKTVVPKESISCTPVVANKPLSTRPNL